MVGSPTIFGVHDIQLTCAIVPRVVSIKTCIYVYIYSGTGANIVLINRQTKFNNFQKLLIHFV